MAWLLLLAALTLSTCGRPDPARPAGTAPSALLDTEWRLAAVDGVPSVSLPGGEALVTVTFTDSDREEPWEGALGGFDGCNAFGMDVRLDGDPGGPGGAAFRAGGVTSDAMACGEPGTHVSDRMHIGLGSSRRVRLSDGRLTFTDSLGAERVAFVPRPVRTVDSLSVTAGRWRLDPVASTVTNSYGGPPGRYTVDFVPGGTYRGEAGCRTFSGDYVLDGDRLSVTSYALDDGACAPDDRTWDGPHGLEGGEIEADSARLVVYVRRSGQRAVFHRP